MFIYTTSAYDNPKALGLRQGTAFPLPDSTTGNNLTTLHYKVAHFYSPLLITNDIKVGRAGVALI